MTGLPGVFFEKFSVFRFTNALRVSLSVRGKSASTGAWLSLPQPFAFFQSPDEPTTLDAYQQMLATDKLLEYAEISLRTLCDLIRYQQLKEFGIVHSAKEFIQLFHSNEQEDTP